ncbi:glycosyltransferase family 2 protein [Actinocrinis puniceicyclus]|uniref:Glycosyltransferase family 2 protein n=1 Tax=Actinocrinis puniceicyclus TaxID=977794 RepID=A0A8J7WLE8_9ACTN|nr:glycosyltransferase family A protein [Actinocrinis puniceicyclus]MBS2961877.1 glycosyltransferase family 2 protein [Actinocrinis puniceicyclus]
MNTISVITAVHNPEAEFLAAAYASLAAQNLPVGWRWEWVVQEDGESGAARAILPGDPRISHGYNAHGGVAITRNLALARAAGGLIKNLDQDDQLTEGTLARDIAVLDADPDVQWTASRALDLMPDGTTAAFGDDPPPGRLRPGRILDYWHTHDYRLPVHPATLCIRRPLLMAVGGWMAVPGSDDAGMLIAASVLGVGHFIGDVGLLYRKWPGQVSAQPQHTEAASWNLRMRLIRERAAAITEFFGPRS